MAGSPTGSLRPTEEHVHRQRRAAVFSLLTVAAFTVAVCVLAVFLGNVAAQRQSDQPNPVPEDSSFIQEPAITDPFYVLLIGSDTRKGTALYTGKANEQGQQDQYADIITLVRVDPATYTITLITVPRDTVVVDGSVKINDALSSGDPLRVVDAVENLAGVHADYYAMTTFAAFERFIDVLGGIDVDVPFTVTVVDPMTAEKVTVDAGRARHLDGAEALVLARARKEYPQNQDALRQVNVRTIERAIIRKVLDYGSDLDVGEALAAFQDNTITDLDPATLAGVVMEFMKHRSQVTFYDATGPYEGAEREADGQWVIPADTKTWERIMALTDAGYDPSGVVEAPSFEALTTQMETEVADSSADL